MKCNDRLTLIAAVLAALLSAPAVGQVPISGTIFDGSGGPLAAGTVYHVTGNLLVPAGETLTVGEGAVIKFLNANTEFSVNGTLLCNGTGANPVVITDGRDDSAGGDSNGDGGATSPAPGFWRGVRLNGTSDASVLVNTTVRYGGAAGISNYYLSDSDATLTSCTSELCSLAGLDLNASSFPTVDGCRFDSNGTVAVDDVPVEAIAGFTGCTATGNATLDTMVVINDTVATPVAIAAANMISGVIALESSLVVSVTGTLTLGQDVILKMLTSNTQIVADGTLNANGTPGSPVTITEIRDDAAGGDTNKDGGSSLPAPGYWRGVIMNDGSDASVLSNTVVRYAGSASFSAFYLSSCDATFTSCAGEQSSQAGMDLNADSFPTVTGCRFDSNVTAVDDVPIEAVAGFTGCTATGNSTLDTMVVINDIVSTPLTISDANLINGVIVPEGNLTVAAAGTLTLEQGVTLKFRTANTQLEVDGTLLCNGTPGSPVVLTELRDDTFAGDTNLDGAATSSAPGFWRGVIMNDGSDASVLASTVVRYAGSAGFSAFYLSSCDATFNACRAEFSSNAGMDLNSSDSRPSVTGCSFDDNEFAVVDVPLRSVPGFANNTATGNTTRDSLDVSSAIVDENVSIPQVAMLNGTLVIATTSIRVDPGFTLAFEAGCIVKWLAANSDFVVDGTLLCSGMPGSPVVFTEIHDDGFGGDTNKDMGATLPTPGYWRGIRFFAGSDASVLDRTIVRYTGSAGFSGIDVTDSSLTMTDSIVEHGTTACLDLNNSLARPSISGSAFNAGTYAMKAIPAAALAGFRHNTASGNSLGDFARITTSALGGSNVLITPYSYPGEVLVTSSNLAVASGEKLTIEAGVKIKFQTANTQILVNGGGTLDVLGTGPEPVILTEFRDDAIGGDTNKDGGSSLPAPGFWRAIRYTSGSLASRCEHVRVRYGGSGGFAPISCDGPSVVIRSARVDHSSTHGFSISALSGHADNWVAYGCAGAGIRLSGGSFNLRHATATGNATGVLKSGAGYTGLVFNTISFGNGTNYAGFAPTDLFSSNGDAAAAGSNGNIDVDPLFTDAAMGDLTLMAASPCIGAADIPTADLVLVDNFETPRRIDADLDGMNFPDMGAFERAAYSLAFTGQPQRGTIMTFTVNGPPGFTVIFAGILNGFGQELPYGSFTVGSLPTLVPIVTTNIGLGFPIAFDFPTAAEGFKFGVQAIGLLGADPQVGNFTNRYRGRLFN